MTTILSSKTQSQPFTNLSNSDKLQTTADFVDFDEFLKILDRSPLVVEQHFKDFSVSDQTFERLVKTSGKNLQDFVRLLGHKLQSPVVEDFVRLHNSQFSAEERKELTKIINNAIEINDVSQKINTTGDEYTRQLDQLAEFKERDVYVCEEQRIESNYVEQMNELSEKLRNAGFERRRRERLFKTIVESGLLKQHTFDSLKHMLLKDAPSEKKKLKLNL